MKLAIVPGTTSFITHVFIRDSTVTTGAGKTALAYGDITAYYVRSGGTLTAMTLETISTLGTWASSGDNYLGFKLLHDTNAPGLYELHLPNNILAAGAASVVLQLRATGAEPCCLEIQLANVAADARAVSGDTAAADNLESACDGGSYNVGGGAVVVASVTGAVGSVTGAVGSVTGNVGGNVAGSVASVTGAVGSVTGNVGGNVAGSVASVTAGVTLADDAITASKFDESTAFPLKSADTGATAVARTGADSDTLETLSDEIAAVKGDTAAILADTGTDGVVVAAGSKTGYALTGDYDAAKTAAQAGDEMDLVDAPNATAVTEIQSGLATSAEIPSAADNADAVWNEAIADHLGAGSTGAALNAAGSAGDPWSTPLPGAYGAGTAGKIVGDNINATVSSRSSHSAADVKTAVEAVGSHLALILADTGTDGVVVAAGSKTGYALTGDYDAAKTAAQAGDEMDLVNAPNATAVTAIQSGLATSAALATVDGNVDAILADTGTDGVVVAAGSKTGYALTGDYDAAKTAAQAGDEMDITAGALAKFVTDDTGETVAADGSVAKIAQGAAGGNVTVGDFTQAALAQMATDDTGETEAASGSVARLAQGAGGDITVQTTVTE